MILKCPQCERQYELQAHLQGKVFRCVCKALLTAPGTTLSTSAAVVQSPSVPQAASAPLTFAEDTSFAVPEGMIFPDFVKLIDLSRYGPLKPEEPVEQDLPAIEDELPSLDLPSFDEDDSSDSIDEALAEETEDLKSKNQKEDSGGIDGAENIKLEDEFAMDPRVKPALDEFAQSQDPQFIVDMLYYLLEVKDPYIRPFVEKHLNNSNPVAAYLAKRIIADQDYIASPQNIKKQLLPYPRQNLLEPLFKGNEHVRMQLLESAVKSGGFGSSPYFTLRLLLERDAFVKSNMLPKLGLIASAVEVPFLSRFLDEPGPKIRLACVEALACIGGDSVIPSMIKGMVDKDHGVVTAIKKALQNADATELSQHIFDYLLQHRVSEKRGYISILADYKNSIAFRALVWMFEDVEIRNFALETAKTFAIPDELKADTIREYLDLSYREDAFQLSVVEVMESLEPTFSRAKLQSVNAFDDSYVSLIRDSPLFVRDFAETSSGSETKQVEVTITPQSYGILQLIQDRLMSTKGSLQRLPMVIKSRSSQIQIALEGTIWSCFGLIWLSIFLKGHGHEPKSIPLSLLPNSFRSNTGYSFLSDSEFIPLLVSNISSGCLALIPAFVIGLTLALQQVRSGNFRLRYLATAPLLISPILLSGLLNSLVSQFSVTLTPVFYMALQFFCLTSLVYMVVLRVCALVPRDWINTHIGLGADFDTAIAETYRVPVYCAGILSVLFGLMFIFASMILGVMLAPDQSAGAWLLSRFMYADGWLVAGAVSVLPLLVFVCPLVLAEMFIPLHCLVPTPHFKAENHKKVILDLLEFWGVAFPNRPRKAVSKSEAKPAKVKAKKK